MNIRIVMIATATVLAAGAASFWKDHDERKRRAQSASNWALQHAQWRNDPNSPLPWRWRAPSSDNRLARWAVAQARDVLLAGAGQEVWAVNEAAFAGARTVPVGAIPLVSLSTAGFLGVDLPMERHHFDMLSGGILAGLEPWRTVMVQQCGDCAPFARAFPAPDEPATTPQNGMDARGATGINIDAERRRRSASAYNNPANAMTAMVMQLRAGELPNQNHWSTPGLAGMAALELAVMERKDLTESLLHSGMTGPSGTDQIAALWAAHLLGGSSPALDAIQAQL